ncbi:MAG: carbohydrate ABC transporter permease [Caldilineaceae bacterium]|nr:carbohydrate ABC transporter permease [Caldilineaceae bacterium]
MTAHTSTEVSVKKNRSDALIRYGALLALLIFLLLMLLPFFMITINSFKTESEYLANGPFSLPSGFDLEAINTTWALTDYSTKLINSLLISSSTALLAVTLSLFNAFALGIGRIRGRTFFLLFFLMAIALPPESLAYPLYYLFNQIDLYNTRLSIILITAALHTAFGTYLLSSVFRTFNQDILESARLDGCNKLQLLLRIVIPLSWPTLSVLFVFFFIWTWNDFFLPLIFLISNDNQTVPIAMALARGERGMVITTQSAAAFLGVFPAFIFFLLFQRTLTKGIMSGASK